MKTKKIAVEVICLIFLLYFFYEGIYKIAYWHDYGIWLKHAPLLNPAWQVLTYSVPLGEIILALAFLFPSQRVTVFYISIIALFVFVCWIMSVYLFTHRLFWPYHAIWEKPTWMQKMLISLGMCWVAFLGIALSGTRFNNKSKFSTPLNEPIIKVG